MIGPFRMPRISDLHSALAPVMVALRRIGADTAHIKADIHRLKEQLMADFSVLNAKLDEHDAAVSGAVQRVNEDVQALRDEIAALQLDTDDQAKVDAAVARVQSSIDGINAIDPVRADEPAEPTE